MTQRRPILAAPPERSAWWRTAIMLLVLAVAVFRFFLWRDDLRRADLEAAPIADPPVVAIGSGEPRGHRLQESGVYFAPLADFPTDALGELAASYESWDLEVEVLPRITIEESAIPPGNSQLNADDLVDQIHRAYPHDLRSAAVLGFVSYDIRAYSSGDFWNLGSSDPAGYAVISTARMNPLSFGEPADERLLLERLRKMTTRYIAFTYFDLPDSRDPLSVLAGPIRSVADLDRLGANPCPSMPREWNAC